MQSFLATYFRQHVDEILEASQLEPILITRYGKPHFVVMSEAYFVKLVRAGTKLEPMKIDSILEDLREQDSARHMKQR